MTSIREIAENFNIYGNFRGTVRFSEPMAGHTTFKVGGPAPLFLEPADTASLSYAVQTFRSRSVPYFILGGGSNIVVSDRGFEGAVISTGGLNAITGEGGKIACGAGVPMASVVNYCTDHSLSGMETFAGLPGTAGGALYMNARCFDVSVSDRLAGAEYIDPETSDVVGYTFDASDWDYKKSPFQNTERIITKAVFAVEAADGAKKEEIAASCRKYVDERVSKGHFRYPSAGSVFRNNRDFGRPSGKIIDEAGLCGYSIGGAQIAPWHGNFIINRNNATGDDIKALVDYTITCVKEKTGFTLEPEIIFAGIQ
jgi:UDP-N-acetylmuramate dehydrogenase